MLSCIPESRFPWRLETLVERAHVGQAQCRHRHRRPMLRWCPHPRICQLDRIGSPGMIQYVSQFD